MHLKRRKRRCTRCGGKVVIYTLPDSYHPDRLNVSATRTPLCGECLRQVFGPEKADIVAVAAEVQHEALGARRG